MDNLISIISIAISVCVCVFLFVCPLAYLKKHPKFYQFFCTRYMWPWLDRLLTVMQYVNVFPVLWMVSCFHIMEQMCQNQTVSSSSPGGNTRRRVGHLQLHLVFVTVYSDNVSWMEYTAD